MLLLYYILQGYIAWRNALAKLKMVLGGIRPGMFPYFCWCLLHRCQLLPLNIFLQTSVIRFPKGIIFLFILKITIMQMNRTINPLRDFLGLLLAAEKGLGIISWLPYKPYYQAIKCIFPMNTTKVIYTLYRISRMIFMDSDNFLIFFSFLSWIKLKLQFAENVLNVCKLVPWYSTFNHWSCQPIQRL